MDPVAREVVRLPVVSEVFVVGFSLVVFSFRAENVTKIHMALALSYGMAMFQCVACCRTDLYTQIYAQVGQ